MMNSSEVLRFKELLKYGNDVDHVPGDFLDKIEWLCDQYVELRQDVDHLTSLTSDMVHQMSTATEFLVDVHSDVDSFRARMLSDNAIEPDEYLPTLGRIETAVEFLKNDD